MIFDPVCVCKCVCVKAHVSVCACMRVSKAATDVGRSGWELWSAGHQEVACVVPYRALCLATHLVSRACRAECWGRYSKSQLQCPSTLSEQHTHRQAYILHTRIHKLVHRGFLPSHARPSPVLLPNWYPQDTSGFWVKREQSLAFAWNHIFSVSCIHPHNSTGADIFTLNLQYVTSQNPQHIFCTKIRKYIMDRHDADSNSPRGWDYIALLSLLDLFLNGSKNSTFSHTKKLEKPQDDTFSTAKTNVNISSLVHSKWGNTHTGLVGNTYSRFICETLALSLSRSRLLFDYVKIRMSTGVGTFTVYASKVYVQMQLIYPPPHRTKI